MPDLASSVMHLSADQLKGWIFSPFVTSQPNSKIPCVVMKEQKVVKLSADLSWGCFFPIPRCFYLGGCFEHVCDTVAVDSVIYPYMLRRKRTLWLGISIL